ncbi:hypothetical protein FB471_3356 [Amycolatopsis cihanbeyliensis]|uniref:Uncharacterized protein n=1 Tax=Amycolatopsis cihanbeyliensis TaxID=1128664 RepID=A0A542DKN7_AMYCI|nr:hypothetical protein FB471_3356 [Amycolatopsis cihanbeyliensis]
MHDQAMGAPGACGDVDLTKEIRGDRPWRLHSSRPATFTVPSASIPVHFARLTHALVRVARYVAEFRLEVTRW